jgi:hypothetical protein
MSSTVTMAWDILDRMERAVAKVRERLLRITAVLNQAGIHRTHVRDLIAMGLIDRSWLAALPPVLAERLQGILDTPDQ